MQFNDTDINTYGWTATLSYVVNTHFQSALISITVALIGGIVGVIGKHLTEQFINKFKNKNDV